MKHGPLGVAMVTNMDDQVWGAGSQSVQDPHERGGVRVGRERDDDITVLGGDGVVEDMARGHQTTGGDQLLTEQPQGCRDRVNNGVTIPVTKRDCFYSLINKQRQGWMEKTVTSTKVPGI